MNATSNKQPSYYELFTKIRKEISEGKWKPGERLPSIRDMAKRYGTGIATVRRVMEMLANENLVTSQQGKGIFVQSYVQNGFWHRFHRFQKKDGSLILQFEDRFDLFETIPADSELAAKRSVEPGTLLVHWRLQTGSDGIVVGYDEAWLPRELCPNLQAKHHPHGMRAGEYLRHV